MEVKVPDFNTFHFLKLKINIVSTNRFGSRTSFWLIGSADPSLISIQNLLVGIDSIQNFTFYLELSFT